MLQHLTDLADRYFSLPRILLLSLLVTLVVMVTEKPRTEVEFILLFTKSDMDPELVSERMKKTASAEQLQFVCKNHPTLYRDGAKVVTTRDAYGKIEITLEGYDQPDEDAMRLFCWTMAQFALDPAERLKKDFHFGRGKDGFFRYITYKTDPPID